MKQTLVDFLKEKFISRVAERERRRLLASPLAKAQLRRNQRRPGPEQGYICGQGAGAVTDGYHYGLASMKLSGCEVIAVYNALVALGEQPDIRELAFRFQKRSAVLGGLFGTELSALLGYFRTLGYEVREYRDARLYDEALAESRVGIFSFWWARASLWLHTVTVRRDGAEVLAYNWSTEYPNGPARFASMEDMIEKTGVEPILFIAIR